MKEIDLTEAKQLLVAHATLLKKIQKLLEPLISGEACIVVASALTTMAALAFRMTDRDEKRWRALCEAAWSAAKEAEMKKKVGEA